MDPFINIIQYLTTILPSITSLEIHQSHHDSSSILEQLTAYPLTRLRRFVCPNTNVLHLDEFLHAHPLLAEVILPNSYSSKLHFVSSPLVSQVHSQVTHLNLENTTMDPGSLDKLSVYFPNLLSLNLSVNIKVPRIWSIYLNKWFMVWLNYAILSGKMKYGRMICLKSSLIISSKHLLGHHCNIFLLLAFHPLHLVFHIIILIKRLQNIAVNMN